MDLFSACVAALHKIRAKPKPARKPKEVKDSKDGQARQKKDEGKKTMKDGKHREDVGKSSKQADLPYTGNYSFI